MRRARMEGGALGRDPLWSPGGRAAGLWKPHPRSGILCSKAYNVCDQVTMMALHTPVMMSLIDDAPSSVRALAQLHGQPYDVIEQGGAPVPEWSHPAEQRGRHGMMRGRSHHHVYYHLVRRGAPRRRALEYPCLGCS
jgi:hypothetical protein